MALTASETLELLKALDPTALAEVVRTSSNRYKKLDAELKDLRSVQSMSEAAYTSSVDGLKASIDTIRKEANAKIDRLTAELTRLHAFRNRDIATIRKEHAKLARDLNAYSTILQMMHIKVELLPYADALKDITNAGTTEDTASGITEQSEQASADDSSAT